MNKAEAQKEAQKIFKEWNKKADEITKAAKENGTWKMGLDSNNGLFRDLDNEMKAKLKSLAEQAGIKK